MVAQQSEYVFLKLFQTICSHNVSHAFTLLELACPSLSMLGIRLLDTGNACIPVDADKVYKHRHTLQHLCTAQQSKLPTVQPLLTPFSPQNYKL